MSRLRITVGMLFLPALTCQGMRCDDDSKSLELKAKTFEALRGAASSVEVEWWRSGTVVQPTREGFFDTGKVDFKASARGIWTAERGGKRVLVDAWRRPVLYRAGATHVVFQSLGPDGLDDEGILDDVVYIRDLEKR